MLQALDKLFIKLVNKLAKRPQEKGWVTVPKMLVSTHALCGLVTAYIVADLLRASAPSWWYKPMYVLLGVMILALNIRAFHEAGPDWHTGETLRVFNKYKNRALAYTHRFWLSRAITVAFYVGLYIGGVINYFLLDSSFSISPYTVVIFAVMYVETILPVMPVGQQEEKTNALPQT